MVDMFEKKMCNYCKKNNCNKEIKIIKNKGLTIYKCQEYIKDKRKLTYYKEIEFVTAKRDYIQLYEK